jgi:DNA-binding NarL/FixJ family response regulator
VGASGYVVKADAGKELLIAAQTVVQGKHFVSTSVAASFPAD